MNGNRSLVSAIRGPITLITLGVLFALNNFEPIRFGFDRTWPVLLIVFGLLSLMRRGLEPAPPPPPPPPAFPPPYYSPQGSYARSTYAQPVRGSTPSQPDAGQPTASKGDSV